MFRPPGLISCRVPILPPSALRFGRKSDSAFSCTISITPIRQNIPKNRTWKKARVRCNSSAPEIHNSTTPQADTVGLSELTFDRLQPTEQDCKSKHKRSFGKFVAREAILDEEYWTAAWLRAESHWEDQPYVRYVESHKRKFAEQEFNALKRRCFGRHGHSLKCLCFVAVKKEDRNIRRTVLNSVVGTLDLSIRQLLQGETFPGVGKSFRMLIWMPLDASRVTLIICHRQRQCQLSLVADIKLYVIVKQEQVRTCVYMSSNKSGRPHRYGYVANVCVAKFARRQGIASNMLELAIDAAKSCGVKELFVHVNTNNKVAQQLYGKIGFEMVEAAASHLSIEQKQLLCLNTD